MIKKTLYKDIKRSMASSLGRFLSIFSLMALGAFGLTGLKSTAPDINTTVQQYIQQTHLADLFIVGSYGLDEHDQAELLNLPQTTLEFGYFTDTLVQNSTTSIRIFSQPNKLSIPELVAGHFPEHDDEIVLNSIFQSQYKLGDTIRVNEKETTVLLKQHDFKITGFVHSSEYLSQTNLGISTLGSGILNGYAFIKPSAFTSDVYTIARLAFDETTEHTFSQAYIDKVLARQQEIEHLLSDNATPRLARIKSEAQSKINQGLQEISTGEQDLKDGQNQLDTALQTIQANQQMLNQQQDTLQANELTLNQGKTQLDASLATLLDTKQQLDEAKYHLESGQKTLMQKKEDLTSAEKTLKQVNETLHATKGYLDHFKTELVKTDAHLSDTKQKIEQAKEQFARDEKEWQDAQYLLNTHAQLAQEKGITQEFLNQQEERLIQTKQNLTQEETDYEQALSLFLERKKDYPIHMAAYQSGLNEYTQNKDNYDQGLQHYQTALETLQQKQAEYQAGLTQYQNGLATYENKRSDYETGLNELRQAKEQLNQASQQLQNAQAEWQEKHHDFQQQKQTATQKIATEKQNIADAKEKLNTLSVPNYHVYTRSTMLGSEGYVTINATSNGIAAVAHLFPVVLYAVAALVTLTTMTRFVNEERRNSGVLKALGYTLHDVVKKFVIYGFISGITGSLLGIITGIYCLPYLLGHTLLANTNLPPLVLQLNWAIIALTLGCTLICSVLPVIWIARKELKEPASTLLLPKAPVSGSKIMLEYLPFIWKRLSFTQKVTARNIFRYKLRMFMTIFGVAGSVTLLFAGLGIVSSLQGIAKRQYHDLLHYQILVIEKDNASTKEKQDLNELVHSDQVKHSLPLYTKIFKKKIAQVNDIQTITMFVSDTQINQYITLIDKDTKHPLSLFDNGVIINEKLAKLLQVNIGDSFTLEENQQTYSLRVAGIAEMYAGHSIYINPTTYEQIFNQSASSNSYLLSLYNTDKATIQQLTSNLLLLNGVSHAIQHLISLDQIHSLVSSLTQVMSILLIVSILLALVILYNLNHINVNERIRELSTIKVLGFFNHEVTFYIYRETIILSLIGIAVGIFLGNILHRIIIELVSTPVIMFNQTVEFWVYVIPMCTIIMILILIGFLINRYLKRIKMLEALKSVD